MDFKKWIRENKKVIILVIILIVGSISILNIIEGLLRGRNVLTYDFLIDLLGTILLGPIFMSILGFIPIVLVIGLCYIVVKFLPINSKNEKKLIQIIIICIVLGMFIIPFFYPILESQGINIKFYPPFAENILAGSHPDDPITLPFFLIIYGIFIGLIIGSVICLIYLISKYNEK
ncbi:MAG: hypothetical protein AABX04_01240 [Nanoarchaeota archaeon]